MSRCLKILGVIIFTGSVAAAIWFLFFNDSVVD